MARIRSIKPDFWSDEKNSELSDSCALFFIALWNFADDEGKIPKSPRQIALWTRRWGIEKSRKFIEKLLENGMLRQSCDQKWLQVVNWTHQRINRPLQPKVKCAEIQWENGIDSLNPHGALTEHSTQGLDRIGEEGSGDAPPPEKSIQKPKTDPVTPKSYSRFAAQFEPEPEELAKIKNGLNNLATELNFARFRDPRLAEKVFEKFMDSETIGQWVEMKFKTKPDASPAELCQWLWLEVKQ